MGKKEAEKIDKQIKKIAPGSISQPDRTGKPPPAPKITWTVSTANFDERVKEQQKSFPRHEGIPLQDIMRTEEGKRVEEEEPKVVDEYEYIDMLPRDFPFLIDVARVFFVGRLEERPVWGSFNLVNMTMEAFWFKIKVNDNDWFKIGKVAGKLEPDEQVTIPILYYPGREARPRPQMFYAQVFALTVERFEQNAYDAWNPLRRIQENSKRVFFEFVYHPNKSRTLAQIYGDHLYDTKCMKYFDIENECHKIRQGLTNRMIDLYWMKQMKKDVETLPEWVERKELEHRIKNNPNLMRGYIKQLQREKKTVNVGKIYETHEILEDQIEKLFWQAIEYMKEDGYIIEDDYKEKRAAKHKEREKEEQEEAKQQQEEENQKAKWHQKLLKDAGVEDSEKLRKKAKKAEAAKKDAKKK